MLKSSSFSSRRLPLCSWYPADVAETGDSASEPYTKSSVTFEKSCCSPGILQLVMSKTMVVITAALNPAMLNHNRIDLLQVLRLSKFRSLKLRVDVPQKSGQHAASAHFDESPDTLRPECVNPFPPTNRVGNLLRNPL